MRRLSATTAAFLAGLLLAVLCLLLAVYLPATSERRFEETLVSLVDAEAIGTDEASLREFAQETMRYLRGDKELWEPRISLMGLTQEQSVSQAFAQHMQTVRGWVVAMPGLIAWVAGISTVLVVIGMVCSERFPLKALWAGAGTVLVLLAAVALWAVTDFNSLWMGLHVTFIPDGIFPAGEPVMLLFPQTLFSAYLPWVLMAFGVFMAALVLIPICMMKFERMRTKG